MQSKLLLAAVAATGALAVRDLSGTLPSRLARAVELQARDENECDAAVAANSDIISDFPAVPTELATLTGLDVPAVTDPCSFPSITGSVGQVITSYSSALQSWEDAHITAIRSLLSVCKDDPLVSQALDGYGEAICTTALAPFTSGISDASATATASGTASVKETVSVTSAGSAGVTKSGESSSTGAAASTAATTGSVNAAPRETGVFVAAAAAAAGIVGAVML